MTISPGQAPTVDERTGRRLIGVLVATAFVVFLNETTMGVALSHVMSDLQISAATAQWLTTAFMLTMAVVIPTTGFIIQRFSTRTVYAAALTFFTVGTLVCATAGLFPLLVVGRVIQALGTAMCMPLMMTTLMRVVPSQRRGATMGNVSLVISVAPALGLTLAGAVLSVTNWRGIFWVMLPIALAMAVVGLKLLTNVGETNHTKLDLLSIPLSALGFGGLVYGLSQAANQDAPGQEPHSHTLPLVCIAIGVVSLVLFALRQVKLQRTNQALLDLRTFRSRPFVLCVTVLVTMMIALFSLVIGLPLLMQDVMHIDPLVVGLTLLPGGLLMGLLGRKVGSWYDKTSPRLLMIPGATLATLALVANSTLGQGSSPWLVFAFHLLLSVGLAFVFTPAFTMSMSVVAPPLYSHASAALGSLQQLAGAIGTAMFITVMTLVSVRVGTPGVDAETALETGIRAGFLVAATVSLVAVACVFFMPRNKPAPPTGHHNGAKAQEV